ncbi:30S ribosomal protein S8 [Haliangium sp. UPWRP_2]|uniref:30S ribosomal protein S8 n=1 Tax=Haliangium sp. UPWRP_2 TaxID=1931276 RepID=UPI000B540E06|nr:30S ribosomal protein S8 [Haliangium sp. UPWRP_2]PSM32439.1 30S ribosomal protein S8 [Haliangium sp. UPWRP_2]
MTDPIGDMLTRIRNAMMARKENVTLPASNLKERVAEILRDEGYIQSVARGADDQGSTLTLGLRYSQDNQHAIQSMRRVSRPGQRIYVGHTAIPRVRSGLGVAILSTSRGVLTDRQARKLGVGGELLCEVW